MARVEPTRPYGQRILSPFEAILPDLTKRDESIFTGMSAVKVMLRPAKSQHRGASSGMVLSLAMAAKLDGGEIILLRSS